MFFFFPELNFEFDLLCVSGYYGCYHMLRSLLVMFNTRKTKRQFQYLGEQIRLSQILAELTFSDNILLNKIELFPVEQLKPAIFMITSQCFFMEFLPHH